MNNLFARFAKDESGATAIEYALIAAIMGVGLIAIFTPLKEAIGSAFTGVKDELTTAGGTGG